MIGNSGSIHLRRWVEHFAKGNDLLVISDSPDRIEGVRVEQVFVAKAGIRNLKKVRQMRRLIREFKPDIVHGHYLTVGGLYASLSGGKRIAASALGSDIYYGPRKSLTERLILWFVLRRCDLIFAVSKDTMDRIRELGYKGKLELVRFGVDPDKFKKYSSHGTDEFRVLSFRYCSPIYNPLVIVSGFKKVLPRIKNAYLYLVDHGSQIDEVHSTVGADRELSSHVRFLPRKGHEEMPEVFNLADVGISIPSSDGMPSSVVEAMSCELPVIVADIPSMHELIDPGVTGHVTKINPNSVGDILVKAYSVRSLLPGMGKRARAKVLDPDNQLTWESNMRVAESAYNSLLKNAS